MTSLTRQRDDEDGGADRPRSAGLLPRSEAGDRDLEVGLLAAVVALVLLMTLGAAGLAYALAGMGEERYAAEAQILYDSPASGAELDQELATQEVLLQSRAVLAPLAEEVGVRVADLQRALDVDIVGGSQILELRFEHSDPDVAVVVLGGIAERYVALSRDTAGQELGGAQGIVEERLAATEEQLAAATARRDELALAREQAAGATGTPPADVEERSLDAEIIRLQQQLGSLQERAVGLQLETESLASARLLDDVYVLEDPVGPRPLPAAAAGALVGLVVSGGAVALYLRRRSAS
jgi:uncharacterized protein involved in exopolysaccharide biosynthesis